MRFEFFLIGFIIALLCIAIIYAIILEKRLFSAKEKQHNLSLLMKQFYESARKVQEEIKKIKIHSLEIEKSLKNEVIKAELVRDELKHLSEKETKAFIESKNSILTSNLTEKLSIEERNILNALKDIQ